MFNKIVYITLLIIATIAFVSGVGSLLSMASWICNILGIIIIPIYAYCVVKLIKLVFRN
jgi:hypothetical protein|nr:MAG TPA: hypothetical protein [Bacteriophage sp.]